MKYSNLYKVVFFVSALLLLGGCASNFIKTYPEDLLPMAEVGTVTCESAIQVLSVDDNPEYKLYSGGGLYYRNCYISLKPGPHKITYKYYFSSSVMTTQTEPVTQVVNAEKGQIYRIKYKTENHRWLPWIEKLQGAEYEEQLKNINIYVKNNNPNEATKAQ